MLSSDKLILVELHRAGSARVKKLLGEIVGGESSSQQTLYSDGLAALGKPVVGYLCNPLSWYLDQWQLGCEGKGEIYKRLTDEARWDQLRNRRANRPVKEGRKADAKPIPAEWNAAHAKSFWYADQASAPAFREWLVAVLDNRGLRRLVNHGYANSPVSRLAGLLTYQFFLMFVRNAENMEKSVDSMEALKALHASQAITSHFVRAESVGADLRKVLDEVGVALSAEQRAAVEALKARAGADEAAITQFYDHASLRLVTRREAFLNELFGYGEPTAEDRKSARREARKERKQARNGDAPEASDAGKRRRQKKDKLSAPEKARKREGRAERLAARAARKAAREGARSGAQATSAAAAPTSAPAPAPASPQTPQSTTAPASAATKAPPAAAARAARSTPEIKLEIEKPRRARSEPKIEFEIEKPPKARRTRGQAASKDLFESPE